MINTGEIESSDSQDITASQKRDMLGVNSPKAMVGKNANIFPSHLMTQVNQEDEEKRQKELADRLAEADKENDKILRRNTSTSLRSSPPNDRRDRSFSACAPVAWVVFAVYVVAHRLRRTLVKTMMERTKVVKTSKCKQSKLQTKKSVKK